MLKFLGRKYVESKYRRNNLRVIEDIPAKKFGATLQAYTETGWELTDNYRSFNEDRERWRCKLRKGTSTLKCEWDKRHNGRISGPAYVVDGLGKEFGFAVLESPKWR